MTLDNKTREEKIDSRCDTLVKILQAVRPIYLTSSPYDQGLIETMIGATIWYIPKPANFWSGKISLAAIKSLYPDPNKNSKLSEEHIFPRKAAARKLLQDIHLDFPIFRSLYREQYGKIHYVTPSENKMLVRFQKADNFDVKKDVYEQAGIQLISISSEQLTLIKKGNKIEIEKILKM